MTRRDTFKLITLGVLGAVLSTLNPPDDSAYVQAMIDAGLPLPPRTYHIYRTIRLEGRHVDAVGCAFIGHVQDQPTIDFHGVRSGRFHYNYVKGTYRPHQG